MIFIKGAMIDKHFIMHNVKKLTDQYIVLIVKCTVLCFIAKNKRLLDGLILGFYDDFFISIF